MELGGYHYVPRSDRLGGPVEPSEVEQGRPVEPIQRRDWVYDGIPEGVTADRYFYTVEDLSQLMRRSPNTVRALAKEHRWRYREDKRFNTKAYYLYDLIATVWDHVITWEGNTLSADLYSEAKFRMLPADNTETAGLSFYMTQHSEAQPIRVHTRRELVGSGNRED